MGALPQILFLLVAAHALCDFPLQGRDMACAKRPGGDPYISWPAALGCHSLIHGGAVALVTGLWWLGVAETVSHATIDFLKCRAWFGMKTDQLLHLVCKLAWAAAWLGVTHG